MTNNNEAEFTLIVEAAKKLEEAGKLEEIDKLGEVQELDDIPKDMRRELIRALAAADMELNRDIYEELANE